MEGQGGKDHEKEWREEEKGEEGNGYGQEGGKC